MRRRAKQRGPLSIRLGEREWAWLEEEAKKRTRAAGVPVGPSSIVRALVEREASGASGRKRLPFENIWEWRKKHQIDKYGLPRGYFDKLRDRSPGPEPTWLDELGPD